MNNKKDLESDKSLPVYEAEIIEEKDFNDIETYISEKPVLKKTSIAQKIGKAAGTIVSIAGLISEFKKYLPYISSKKKSNETKNNNRKQRRRFRSRK